MNTGNDFTLEESLALLSEGAEMANREGHKNGVFVRSTSRVLLEYIDQLKADAVVDMNNYIAQVLPHHDRIKIDGRVFSLDYIRRAIQSHANKADPVDQFNVQVLASRSDNSSLDKSN
jgi:hypothetical protein